VAAPGRTTQVSASVLDFESARKKHGVVYLVEYDLIHDVQRHGKNPLDLLIGARPDRCWRVTAKGACESLSGGGKAATAESAARAVEAPRIAAPAEAPMPALAVAAAGDTTVRLNVALLDLLMNLAGELVLGRNQLAEAVRRRDDATIAAASQQISVITADVQEAVMRTRMLPVSNLFQKFPRFLRETARQLSKDVELVCEGGDVELDKTIAEGLSDPLSHMVRNAVDHGIEGAEERLRRGKPRTGTVTLRAWHEAGMVVIEVADDGRGLDASAIAEAAVRKGLAAADAVREMSEQEKLSLIFLPGLSTARRVTDISGRGVGMDVVKTNLDRLGGDIEVHSQPGQ
jgi:two-component system chemotaxis sensor kinase CheA